MGMNCVKLERMYRKSIAVVESVTTAEQLEAAQKYVELFMRQLPNNWKSIDELIILLKIKEKQFKQES